MIKPATLSLSLKNHDDQLEVLADAVDEFAERQDFSESDRFQLQLCLEEIFMYLVRFGYSDLDEHEVSVELELEDGRRRLAVRVVNDGDEYDPAAGMTDTDLDSLLEDQAMGGVGFHLVRSFVDDMAYERRGGRNYLSLRKTLEN